MNFKNIKILALFSLSITVNRAFCQIQTYKYLLGTWEWNTGQPGISAYYEFKNENTVVLNHSYIKNTPESDKNIPAFYGFIFRNNGQYLLIQQTTPDSTKQVLKVVTATENEIDFQMIQIAEYNPKTQKWSGQDMPGTMMIKWKRKTPKTN
jgi:hypothetical protein